MRILYVSQYFPPEIGAPAVRVHELSREWVQQGHDVTVLTGFAHHPTGIKSPQDRWRLTRRENRDGIEVLRTYVWATANRGRVRRMLTYASFMASVSVIGAVRARRPEIVVATSPQLLSAWAGFALARRFRVPFIFEVRDLWPESILAVAALSENWVVRGLRRLAGFLYARCDRIVTVGPGYRQEICARYGTPAAKIAVIANGIDTALFQPARVNGTLRQQHGWEGKFVVLYLGTHGMAHGLDVVLAAARVLRDHPDIRFALVGAGAEKANLEARAARERLGNVQFIGPQPHERVPSFYAACDLGLVTLRDAPLFQNVLPSKIFEYLGMERAVIVSVPGEARQLVEAAGAGIFVPPGNSAALARAILQAYQDRPALLEMGRRGRQYVLQYHDRRLLAQRYLEVLREVLEARPLCAERLRRWRCDG